MSIQNINGFQNINDSDESQIMKQKNVIFGGTCRNVEGSLEKIISHVEECGKKFNDFAFVVYENDSSDNTRTILEHNKKNNYYYIFEDNITEPKRTKRIERGRNLILDKVRKMNKDNYYQYLIILDFDNANSEGSFVNSIDSCFVKDDWDVLTGNQIGRYYDTWALRNDDVNYDCWKETSDTKPICFNINLKYPQKQWKEVDSAFGGIAIYKLSSIPNHCRYVGEFEDGTEKCEHIEFNKCIKQNGGKIFINGDFLNDGY